MFAQRMIATPTMVSSRSRATTTTTRAAAFEVPSAYKTVAPCAQGVLVKVAAAEKATKGGIILTESAQRKPTSGDIAAVGPDVKGVSVGKTVLYSKFGIGCVDLVVGGEDYVLIKEQDLIGCFPSSGARASDIPKLEPCGDRVLLKVDAAAATTKGGILLTEGAKEKPVSGVVVAAGPGKAGEDGVIKPLTVKAGDKVIYFKYAGDQMTDEEGNAFVVLHENDLLARL